MSNGTALITDDVRFEPAMDRDNVVPDFARFVPPGIELPPTPSTSADSSYDDTAWVTRLGFVGFVLILLSTLLLLLDLPAGLAGMFFGAAVFSLANYVAYRFGRPAWIEPALAAKLVLACSALALTAAAAGLAP